ncbi:hypothetical protein CONPUDRAFT_65116 [Coniophora puteana RWD-64-598 SS2]|uniref:D-lactate dehydrogenase (cytochrome) n=1 Tax=Coniophora puteana (strain RWD-64-598) TaxID=741705 RepID=A0A5M3M9F0_CONPW|nr:uncharacterized protein CONPUDRAFT_65116 [Coniophora puteana RWD-64-598 SS2]EIW75912.1 hypothetical protein CONPUDRAFT_65116 [Coniophora puteana RWD-64-598 SS2]
MGGVVAADDEEPRHGPSFPKAIEELKEALSSEQVTTDPKQLLAYAQSVLYHEHLQGQPHAVVIHVRSTEDVVKVVHIARKHLVAVVPYAGGTSLEGNVSAPSSGSICVDLSGLNKILEINESDADVVCQAGVTWNDLNEQLKMKGIPLFFPLDPGRNATVGGMIATGCSGTNAMRYGTARGEWILNVTVVLPSGEVIKTRRRARKSSAGFDLTKLFIGAEGTLGIVTEATLRLAPVLPTRVAIARFPDVQTATNAVCDVLNRGPAIQCVELIDELGVKVLNHYNSASSEEREPWPEQVTLFLKLQGCPFSMLPMPASIEQIMRFHGATSYRLSQSECEDEQIWDERRNGLFAALAYKEGSKGWITDVCVPVSRLPELITSAKGYFKELGITAPIAGHVGDGNFHALVLYNPDDPGEVTRAREAVARITKRAIELDGTCTGEHGVGQGKRKWLEEELGQGTVDLMRTIKQTLDPDGLFNPGKVCSSFLALTRLAFGCELLLCIAHSQSQKRTRLRLTLVIPCSDIIKLFFSPLLYAYHAFRVACRVVISGLTISFPVVPMPKRTSGTSTYLWRGVR